MASLGPGISAGSGLPGAVAAGLGRGKDRQLRGRKNRGWLGQSAAARLEKDVAAACELAAFLDGAGVLAYIMPEPCMQNEGLPSQLRELRKRLRWTT